MAKSIRSKKMRKNRSEIRKNLSAPMVAQRTETLSRSLQEELKARQSNTGLNNLKKLLTPTAAAAGKAATASTTAAATSSAAVPSKTTKGK
jgi:hypothetical protein